MPSQCGCCAKSTAFHRPIGFGMLGNRHDCPGRDDRIQHQVGSDENDGDVDGFFEALQKYCTENREQQQRDEHLAGEPLWRERIVDEVRRRVRCGKRHGDDEVGGRKSQESENKDFAPHSGNSRSSMAMLPCPLGLACATRL